MSLILVLPLGVPGQLPPPIIDVHLRSLGANDQGPPPLSICLPTTSLGAASAGSSWGVELLTGYKDPSCVDPAWSPETDDALMEETVAIMERRNIIGVEGQQVVQHRPAGMHQVQAGGRDVMNMSEEQIALHHGG